MDFETTSLDDEKSSINPWHSCFLLGIAITWDDHDTAYYIPIRHRQHQSISNVTIGEARAFLTQVLSITKNWINHNIKYDVHALYNDFGIEAKCRLVDSLTMCKLCKKEERLRYNLTEIMGEWYDTDISQLEHTIKRHIKKDYGVCPIDYMAEYACTDVISVRTMKESWDQLIPAETARLKEIEIALTPCLVDIERKGLRVDQPKLEQDKLVYGALLETIAAELSNRTGLPQFRAHTNSDCYAYFCSKMGYPIIEYTEKQQPSFSEDVIKQYSRIPGVDGAICDLILAYKMYQKTVTSFILPYLQLNVDGILHCDYNQSVRTGRMSCRNPNMQQLNALAKRYIIPRVGKKLVELDFSQIEYRMIVHYIENEDAIKAYNENPDTDFHLWMSKQCNVDRKFAKTLNFLLGYGGGITRLLQSLTSDYLGREEYNASYIQTLAEDTYSKYHKALPTLTRTKNHAASVMRQRGYVKTILNRRRYLPYKYNYKAFNTVCQGSAADLMKERTVALHKETDSIVAIVHDSWLLEVNIGEDTNEYARLLESPEDIAFSVPLICKTATSTTNWGDMI